MRSAKEAWFTLLELLIVIAIMAILAGLLLPTLKKAKEKTQQIQCVNNLKQLGVVTFSYAGDYGDFPWYSGTGGWSNTFIQTGHINWRSDRKWLYCPVWKMPNMFDAEGGLISWQRMYGANYNYNYTYPKLRMSSMSNPSHCDMFTDSVFYYPSSSAHLTQWLYYSSKDAGSPQRVHMRHFNGANLWFFDGHADWFSRDKLSEPNYFVVASDGFKGFYP